MYSTLDFRFFILNVKKSKINLSKKNLQKTLKFCRFMFQIEKNKCHLCLKFPNCPENSYNSYFGKNVYIALTHLHSHGHTILQLSLYTAKRLKERSSSSCIGRVSRTDGSALPQLYTSTQ